MFPAFGPTILICVFFLSGYLNSSGERGQNLALRKNTSQISTQEYAENGILHSGNSSAAVDGNVMAQGPNQTCTHTADHIGKTWWQVDLGDIYFITDVKILIFLRVRAVRNFTIEASLYWNHTSKEMIRPKLCYKQVERVPAGEMTQYLCGIPVMGRYVRITKQRPPLRRLSLCEVEVYGKSTVRYNILDVRKGKRSRSRRIEAIRAASVVTCSALCKNYEQCTSFNMAAEGGVCEIIADPIGYWDVNEESTSDWTRYVMI